MEVIHHCVGYVECLHEPVLGELLRSNRPPQLSQTEIFESLGPCPERGHLRPQLREHRPCHRCHRVTEVHHDPHHVTLHPDGILTHGVAQEVDGVLGLGQAEPPVEDGAEEPGEGALLSVSGQVVDEIVAPDEVTGPDLGTVVEQEPGEVCAPVTQGNAVGEEGAATGGHVVDVAAAAAVLEEDPDEEERLLEEPLVQHPVEGRERGVAASGSG